MEPKLKIEKGISEWICCEYGYTNRVSVCIRVENGQTPFAAKVIGLGKEGATDYVEFEKLENFLMVLPPFINAVMEARGRTQPYDPDDPELNQPIEKLYDKIDEFEAAARLAEEGM